MHPKKAYMTSFKMDTEDKLRAVCIGSVIF
jgi:hypothetical protein